MAFSFRVKRKMLSSQKVSFNNKSKLHEILQMLVCDMILSGKQTTNVSVFRCFVAMITSSVSYLFAVFCACFFLLLYNSVFAMRYSLFVVPLCFTDVCIVCVHSIFVADVFDYCDSTVQWLVDKTKINA